MATSVRFIWPSQRYDRVSKRTTGAAILATASLTIAIFLPAVRVYNVVRRLSPTPVVHRDMVIFVAPAAAQVRSVAPAIPPRFAGTASRRTAVTRSSRKDTSAVTMSRVESVMLPEETSGRGTTSTPVSTNASLIGPVLAPVAASQEVILSDAARDSLNRLMASVWDFRKKLPPTAAQRDSAARDVDRRAMMARDEHRPMAIPLGSMGVSLPFGILSRGISREQRARDSSINADNVQRLARLAERARRRSDSLLAASTLARATKGLPEPRADSIQLPKSVPRP